MLVVYAGVAVYTFFMPDPVSVDIDRLIEHVSASPESDFYRDIWKGENTYAKLPAISRTDFIAAPLSRRRYKQEKALVKTVHTADGIFLSEWSFSDIAKEDYGPVGMRPLIYFADPDEAIEKALWCYERKILPLIGEKLPEVVASAAEFYRIDSIIADTVSLERLLPFLRRLTQPLASISIIDASFNVASLLQYVAYASRIHLTLALPETGAYASAPLNLTPSFSLQPGCFIEEGPHRLLTKVAPLVTPIIKYALPNHANNN